MDVKYVRVIGKIVETADSELTCLFCQCPAVLGMLARNGTRLSLCGPCAAATLAWLQFAMKTLEIEPATIVKISDNPDATKH